MKKMKELQAEQEKLTEELERIKVQLQKKTQDVEAITDKIVHLKEQLDFGSFRFVHTNMPEIIQAIAPKHKIPKDREFDVSGSSLPMKASIPWSDEECSDDNPCNAGICSKCTLIHFHKLLDRLLAGYYSK